MRGDVRVRSPHRGRKWKEMVKNHEARWKGEKKLKGQRERGRGKVVVIFLQLCTPENHTSPIVVIHTDKVLILHIPVAQNTFFFLSFFFYFITFAPQNEDNRNDGTPLESGCVNMYIIKISDLWCEVTWAQGHSGNPNKFDLNWMWMWSQWRRSGGLCGLPSSGGFININVWQCQKYRRLCNVSVNGPLGGGWHVTNSVKFSLFVCLSSWFGRHYIWSQLICLRWQSLNATPFKQGQSTEPSINQSTLSHKMQWSIRQFSPVIKRRAGW